MCPDIKCGGLSRQSCPSLVVVIVVVVFVVVVVVVVVVVEEVVVVKEARTDGDVVMRVRQMQAGQGLVRGKGRVKVTHEGERHLSLVLVRAPQSSLYHFHLSLLYHFPMGKHSPPTPYQLQSRKDVQESAVGIEDGHKVWKSAVVARRVEVIAGIRTR